MWFKAKPVKFAAFKQQLAEGPADSSRRSSLVDNNSNSIVLRSQRQLPATSSSRGFAKQIEKFCLPERRSSTLTASTLSVESEQPSCSPAPRHRRCVSYEPSLSEHARRGVSTSPYNEPLIDAIYLDDATNGPAPIVVAASSKPSHRRSASLGAYAAFGAPRSYMVELPAHMHLGVCFEERDGAYVVHSVHATTSGASDVFAIAAGDVLIAINNAPPFAASPLALVLDGHHVFCLPPTDVARTFLFELSTAAGRHRSAPTAGIDVLWLPHQTLGLVLHADNDDATAIERIVHGRNPGMRHLAVGCVLRSINGVSTSGQSFPHVCDRLTALPKPALLRFAPRSELPTPLRIATGYLYHIVWSGVGPLQIALSRRNPSPVVVRTRASSDVCYQPTTPGARIEVGDELIKLNYRSVVDREYEAILAELRSGLKPIILTFFRPISP
ncbi:hypothetical protein SPRG_03358 [Saprolegnia parasitica CBS 223.65]|uniref:PDZ domain-containing protein n=1 Tax=Saprolegnia parasitica (strain CBS 223.65) TaxID=695850 RepID=A0A067D070_SAPPC|nr:hypothetical protein SPRG_03358 [Saprolegnia parasitica CBS 223.65]KDO32141.1 hypothetical protein SPRG_03358 [Saprolegnia parasitica CBS 223.65]|eukprot:XP_012197325.1 hypothetical protein SPRG_03358 [Saprolegnia parasitica CBS 223.65]